MIARLLRLVLISIAALTAPALQAQPAPARIVAVGDLHGDFAAWQAISRAAGLVDARGRWSGGRTVLVQLGDIVDRGPDSLRIIEQLMRLQREAPRAGGRVIVLVGNHEAMMMTNDLRYVHPGEYAAFATGRSPRLRQGLFESQRERIEAAYRARTPDISREAIKDAWMAQTPLGMVEHRQAWAPSGRLGRWTIANPAAVKVGDTLFVHGGISADYARLSLEDINQKVDAALQAQSEEESAIINDPLGPLWYRGLISRNGNAEEPTSARAAAGGVASRPTIEQELSTALSAFGAKRMVVGHTPNPEGIVIAHQGRLVQVDSGNSRAYQGTPSYLEIIGDRLVPHKVPRPGQ